MSTEFPIAPAQQSIDPRGPRFGATITSGLLIIAIFFALIGNSAHTVNGTFILPEASFQERFFDTGALIAILIAISFAWGAIAGVSKHPWGIIFRTRVRPRLSAPQDLEPAAPPRFAQAVGLIVVGVGIILHLFGVPLALIIALAAALIAAGLNALVGFCLGCEIYLLLARLGIFRPSRTA